MLKKVGHDEGYYAGELAAHVRRLGGAPSNKTGDFVEKVRAVNDLRGKLELLNRGQRWVIRKIEENLQSLTDADLRAFLDLMAKGHRVNIGALDDALKEVGFYFLARNRYRCPVCARPVKWKDINCPHCGEDMKFQHHTGPNTQP